MAADRESEVIVFHRAWMKAGEQPFDSRKPFPRELRSLAAAAFGLRLPNAVRNPRKVRFPESSPDPGLLARAKNDGEVRAKATGDLHSADRAMRWGRAFSFWKVLQRRFFRGPE